MIAFALPAFASLTNLKLPFGFTPPMDAPTTQPKDTVLAKHEQPLERAIANKLFSVSTSLQRLAWPRKHPHAREPFMVEYNTSPEVEDGLYSDGSGSNAVFSGDLLALRQGFARDNRWGRRMWLFFVFFIFGAGLVMLLKYI
jgi:hypothetical protein